MLEGLASTLKKSRYIHCLHVEATAAELAQFYGVDRDKAALAGLLHDCSRYLPPREMLRKAEEAGIAVTPLRREQPDLLHPMVSAVLAREVYGVEDEQVLHAIASHMQGSVPMSGLDMVVNAADYVEPGRDFPGVVGLRREMKAVPLPELLLHCMKGTMVYLLEQETACIDPQSVETINYLIKEISNGR